MITKILLLPLLALGIQAAASQLQVSPMSVYLTATVNGPTAFDSVMIMNQGPDPINGVNVMNYCGADFYVSNFCSYILNPYQNCQVNIQFHPTSDMNQYCSIQVNSNDGGFTSISVSGRGVKN